jgi:ketosteroid isomerase-like protein
MAIVSAVQAEIEDRLKRHAEALARRDADGALQIFTPDAVVKPPNMEPLRGTAALREFFERTFAAMAIGEGRFFTEELYLYEGLAFHFGAYEFSTPFPRRQKLFEKGSFSIVWRRQRDGSWRYHRGILSSSLGDRRTGIGETPELWNELH